MSKVYKAFISALDRLVPVSMRPFWEHPAGPKTIFFWAPAFKWGLVIAGLGDINRPADKISLPQVASLTVTSAIWSRYSLVIQPRIWSLFAVNTLVGVVNCYQLVRAYMYKLEQEKLMESAKKK